MIPTAPQVQPLPYPLQVNLLRLDRMLKSRRIQPSALLDLLADLLVAHTDDACGCQFLPLAERPGLHPHHANYGDSALSKLSGVQLLQLFNLIETLDLPANNYRRGATGIRLIQDWILPRLDPAAVQIGVPGRVKKKGLRLTLDNAD